MLSLFTVAILFASCAKDKDPIETSETPQETVQKTAEIDVASDQVANILEEVFVLEEGLVGYSKSASLLPLCATRTVVIDGLVRTVIIDFGESCELYHGDVVSGIITIVYERDPEALTRTITYTFTDFYFNNKNIEGGGSIFREFSNDAGNPQSTFTNDITVTWTSGASAHRVGERVREWIAGFGSGTWEDNVFLITGNRTTTFPDGDVNTGVVTEALRREIPCHFIVSGTIALTHNAFSGTLDFGEGTCDNEAIFTNTLGESHIITLH